MCSSEIKGLALCHIKWQKANSHENVCFVVYQQWRSEPRKLLWCQICQYVFWFSSLVSNINGIYTSGSGLESTCLVFAYGLDLFWTRVTPSRMFDVLKEDFDYWFIVGTLGILVLVTIVSQRLASIKMLRQAWQWNTWIFNLSEYYCTKILSLDYKHLHHYLIINRTNT